jgi:hypothetical protein
VHHKIIHGYVEADNEHDDDDDDDHHHDDEIETRLPSQGQVFFISHTTSD